MESGSRVNIELGLNSKNKIREYPRKSADWVVPHRGVGTRCPCPCICFFTRGFTLVYTLSALRARRRVKRLFGMYNIKSRSVF